MPGASPRACAVRRRSTWARSALSVVSQRARSAETARKTRTAAAMSRARAAPRGLSSLRGGGGGGGAGGGAGLFRGEVEEAREGALLMLEPRGELAGVFSRAAQEVHE